MKRIIAVLFILCISAALSFGAVGAKPKIGMKKARSIASHRVAGKIESGEIEKEHGQWIYSFDIRNRRGTISEVQVNAYTGRIVSVTIENAKQEADEKKAEKKEKH